jgi:ApbE superfamily uncharacterized protein (UPF0280 family)
MAIQVAFLADRRLHLQEGPIDLIIGADGPAEEVSAAHDRAIDAFDGLLAELVMDLKALRRPVREIPPPVRGPVARRMIEAAQPHLGDFVTPMAAVAGAVADHVLAAMLAGTNLAKAYVNDGGDIAFHLSPDQRFKVGLVPDISDPALAGRGVIGFEDPVRGVATSGQGGRSFSLGIADAVTVLARTSAEADIAATLIANAVDLVPVHPAIQRGPANIEDPDSDLGDRSIVLSVGELAASDVQLALDRGLARAEEMRRAGLIHAAVLALRGEWRSAGSDVLTIS